MKYPAPRPGGRALKQDVKRLRVAAADSSGILPPRRRRGQCRRSRGRLPALHSISAQL